MKRAWLPLVLLLAALAAAGCVPPAQSAPPAPAAAGVAGVAGRVWWPAAGQVALTFDDGPSAFTAPVSSTLERYGVRGTFFEVGYQIEASRDVVRSLNASGHSVQNHSYWHPDLTTLDDFGVWDELRAASDFVAWAADGARPTCFRPPYGRTDARVNAIAAQLGLQPVLWNVDPGDYLRPAPSTIADRVLAQADGRGLVVGLHDGGGDRTNTVAALPAIIEGLAARGYQFVTLCP